MKITDEAVKKIEEDDRIDALRIKAFKTNADADRQAYFDAVSKWFQGRHDRSAALPYLQAGYAVKQLKWKMVGIVEQAISAIGLYVVWEYKTRGYFGFTLATFDDEIYGEMYPSFEAAKDAAQADFERRVRECIDGGVDVVAIEAKHDREMSEVIKERDQAEAWADKLAHAIDGEDIGEHSNINNPWENALEIAETRKPVDASEAINSAALIVEGRSTAANGDLVKSLIGKNENEIAEILANHDKALAAEIRALSEKPFNKKLIQNGVVSIDLMQRIWANLYFDEEDAGCTFGNTINDVVDWLGDHNALPESCESFTPAYPLPSKPVDVAASVMRPISNINCRTPQEVFDMMCARIRAMSATPAQGEQWQPTHRHVKRGAEYQLIGTGKMQAEEWQVSQDGIDQSIDMQEVAIYRGDDDQLWVRPIAEFNDGRFERLPAAPTEEEEK